MTSREMNHYCESWLLLLSEPSKNSNHGLHHVVMLVDIYHNHQPMMGIELMSIV